MIKGQIATLRHNFLLIISQIISCILYLSLIYSFFRFLKHTSRVICQLKNFLLFSIIMESQGETWVFL